MLYLSVCIAIHTYIKLSGIGQCLNDLYAQVTASTYPNWTSAKKQCPQLRTSICLHLPNILKFMFFFGIQTANTMWCVFLFISCDQSHVY